MSRGIVLRAPGHETGRSHKEADQAYDDRGRPIDGKAGYAKCRCREVSPTPLETPAARLRWLRRHREEAAGAPWSDTAIARKYA